MTPRKFRYLNVAGALVRHGSEREARLGEEVLAPVSFGIDMNICIQYRRGRGR